jgi:uncharacterized protein YbaP (TraB family)
MPEDYVAAIQSSQLSILKMKKLILVIALFSASISAQQKSLLLPSVWAWEIKNNNRTLYILGELHGFTFQGKNDIILSHDLGRKIYEISDVVWIEQQQELVDKNIDDFKLSNQIEASTWERIKTGFRRAIDSMIQLNEKQRTDLLTFYIENIDAQDPATASVSLTNFANAKITANKPIFKYYMGFGNTLKKEEKNHSKRKLAYLESTQSIATSWWTNCNDKNKAETLIQDALKMQMKDYDFENKITNALQESFIKNENDANVFSDGLVDESNVYKIIMQCINEPRTKNWMPKIIEALSTKGPPITYLVGISHIGGKQGILALLKKEGFTGIKRIYDLNN